MSNSAATSSSVSKAQTAYQSLSSILTGTSFPPSENPAFSLLHDPQIASHVSAHLRQPNSGAGDDNLCRWLYDTFQSTDPDLQLVVIRFLPIVTGVYLSRVTLRKPLAGFEAVLLALYAHETTARNGQSLTVNVPDLSHPSVYHESKAPTKNNATDLNLAVISPSLEPHGTMRSTRRPRIVGVALELYFSKIWQMPVGSKIDFCEFCEAWAGQDGEIYGNNDNKGKGLKKENAGKESVQIPLPWELLQPVLRILGHCLMGIKKEKEKELFESACCACRSLYARTLHDINPNGILATGSLLRLSKMAVNSEKEIDHTEIPITTVISL